MTKFERDGHWSPDQAVLPLAIFHGDQVTIHHVRNARYRDVNDYDVRYYDKTYDLKEIETVWYGLEPFYRGFLRFAHAFVSFGFRNGDYVAISIEIRKRFQGEEFSLFKGLFRSYPLMYVIADERDVVKLRSNHRRDPVYLYPITATTEAIRKLFISMLTRANTLATKPEWYHPLWNTCTTNIVDHVNEIVPDLIPLNFHVIVPTQSDRLIQRLGLIDQNRPIEELRKQYSINERALRAANDPDFSRKIRGL